MCLAIPGQVIERTGDAAVADLHGNRVKINVMLTPDAGVGDWVLMHAGFAIQRLDAEEAQRTFAALDDLRIATNGGEP